MGVNITYKFNTDEDSSFGNISEVSTVSTYTEYVEKEQEQLEAYKTVGYVMGTLIILSNLVVVISSGLILKKGQQSKSTYLILGNVALADTIVGLSLIFGLAIENPKSDNTLCIFQMGLLVCPAMVSIFSVGLIAVDRYLYILHGLYYQRWFCSTRVRILIFCVWMIGIVLGFLPATGWINHELKSTRCLYVGLFPGEVILLNSFLSIIPIAMVGVLYSIILVKALKTVNNLNAAKQNTESNTASKSKLRMSRGTGNYKKQNSSQSLETPKNQVITLVRSASFSLECIRDVKEVKSDSIIESKSIFELAENRKSSSDICQDNKISYDNNLNKSDNKSELSIYTIDSDGTERNESKDAKSSNHYINNTQNQSKVRKTKEPNKWRAVTVVMLTSGSVIVTWLPFFFTVIFFVFCEDKLINPRCFYIRSLLSGPLATLAFLNSILNPLIYAWWHKGFQKSVKNFYKKYFRKFFLISR